MFEACWGVVFEHYIMQCILRCKLRIRVYRNLQCVECIEYTRICVTQPIPTTCGLMSFQNSVTRWCQSIYRLPYPDITHSRVWSDTCGLPFFFFWNADAAVLKDMLRSSWHSHLGMRCRVMTLVYGSLRHGFVRHVYDPDGFLAICATRRCVAACRSLVTCIIIKLHISGKTKLNYLIILSK